MSLDNNGAVAVVVYNRNFLPRVAASRWYRLGEVRP